MPLITFQAFRTAINTLVFPEGQAETRVPLFRNFIVNALIQLQTFVESYQSSNVNFYDKDQSWDDCGLSIIQACRGRIGAVYAFKPSCRCQRFYYDSASLEKLSCLYEHCRCHQSGSCCCGQSMFSEPSLYTSNPHYCGDYVGGETGCQPPYLAATPEDDCAFRLSEKLFAIGPNQKMWLFPRFPCGYIIGVHWRGIRRSYLDNDYVPDDDDLKDAVALYVESEIARRVDKDQATADKLYAEYRMKAGDIIFREEQDLKPRVTRICVEGLDQSELVQIYPVNLYPNEIGQTCATSSVAPQVELEAPVMDLNSASNSANITSEWTQDGTQPDTYEIWRSVNGGGFALIAETPGDVTAYTDSNPMPAGDIWCYKVRGVTGDVQSDFSNEWCALNEYTFATEGGAVSHPTWRLAFGDFFPIDPDTVTSLDLRNLKSISGNFEISGNQIMTSLNLDSLRSIEGNCFMDGSQVLTTISLPSLMTVGGTLLLSNSAALTTMSFAALATVGLSGDSITADFCFVLTTASFPSLVSVFGDISFPSCTVLNSVTFTNFVFANGRTFQIDNCALSAASVNHLLARLVASGTTSAALDTSNGTSSAPTGQGIADKAAAILAGNTVSTN